MTAFHSGKSEMRDIATHLCTVISKDITLRMMSMATWKTLWEKNDIEASNLIFDREGNNLACVIKDTIRSYNADNGDLIFNVKKPENFTYVTELIFNLRSSKLFALNNKEQCAIFKMPDGEYINTVKTPQELKIPWSIRYNGDESKMLVIEPTKVWVFQKDVASNKDNK